MRLTPQGALLPTAPSAIVVTIHKVPLDSIGCSRQIWMLEGPTWPQALIPVMLVLENLLLYSSKSWPSSFEACAELFSDWLP